MGGITINSSRREKESVEKIEVFNASKLRGDDLESGFYTEVKDRISDWDDDKEEIFQPS